MASGKPFRPNLDALYPAPPAKAFFPARERMSDQDAQLRHGEQKANLLSCPMYGPPFLAGGVRPPTEPVTFWLFRSSTIPPGTKDLLTSFLNVAAIIVGFLVTTQSILVSLDSKWIRGLSDACGLPRRGHLLVDGYSASFRYRDCVCPCDAFSGLAEAFRGLAVLNLGVRRCDSFPRCIPRSQHLLQCAEVD